MGKESPGMIRKKQLPTTNTYDNGHLLQWTLITTDTYYGMYLLQRVLITRVLITMGTYYAGPNYQGPGQTLVIGTLCN